jgi:hypothetical protein
MQITSRLVLLCAFCGIGCQDARKPCYGIQIGEEYEFELVERWDEDSSYERSYTGPYAYGDGCGPDLDIWEGDRVRVIVEDQALHTAAECIGSLVRLSDPETHGWEILQSSNANQYPRHPFFGQFSVRIGDCEGRLQLRVLEIHGAPDLESVSPPGEMPYFVLDRTFNTSSCPVVQGTGCGDHFVVNITKLE